MNQKAPTIFYRVDLDKTYLATAFERKLALLKIPFEAPEAKRTLPGMSSILRAIKLVTEEQQKAHLSILSSSPTFLRDKIRAKLQLDGIAVDQFILRDQWDLVKKRRFRELLDPFAYKLLNLLQLGQEITPPAQEILIGDDWELDPLIYAVYSEIRSHRLTPKHWEKLKLRFDIHRELLGKIEPLLAFFQEQSAHETQIFIRKEKRRGEAYYNAFGSRIHVYDDAFQLGILLFDSGLIAQDSLTMLVEDLQKSRWRKAAFAISWRSLILNHHLRYQPQIETFLVAQGLIDQASLLKRLLPKVSIKASRLPLNWDKVLEVLSQ